MTPLTRMSTVSYTHLAPATLLDHLDTPLFILDEVGGIRDAQKLSLIHI